MLPENLTLPILIGAALLDSINPCVFGVLIFLIAFMTTLFKSANRMLIGGLLYSLVVYLTYFFIGLGFITFTISFGFSVVVYWIAGLIAIIAGIIEIKDFFWYGRWFSLSIIPGADKRIAWCTHQIKRINKSHPNVTYILAALLGIFVVAVELPCTGAPYLAILALVSKGLYSDAVPLLLLYNLIFILPLFVIIGFAYFGTSSRRLEQWRKKHRRWMRLAVGVFLLALGFYMLYSI